MNSNTIVNTKRSALDVTSSDKGKLEHEELKITDSFGRGKKRFQYLISLYAALLGVQSGISLGWTSPILPYLTSKESFLPEISKDQISWISSLLALGAIVGALPAGKIADCIGRRWIILLTAVPFIISWLVLILTKSVGSIYIARFVGGIGAGLSCVLVPIYIGEIAQASIRGALGVCFPLLFSVGIVISYVAGAYCSYTTFNIICCALLLPFLLGASILPESPIWLVQRGRKEQVSEVLTTLRGSTYDITKEIDILQDDVNRVARGGLKDLAGTKAGRKAIVTCVGLMSFQQLCGIDAILFYTVNIFQAANSTIDPFLATIIVGSTEVVMTVFVATVIDKFGRKPLLIVSGTGMSICLGVLGYYFRLKNGGADVSAIGWLPLTCLTLFNIIFSIGYGPVPFTVISEMFPPETKGVASSMSIMVHWSLVFAVTKLFPIMEDRIGQAATFWVFVCFTVTSVIFSYFLVPETKGKTLQEIQRKLKRKRDAKTEYSFNPV